ncbi:hypothetical protein HUK84_10435 [Nguyenibacter vanlangensis]|uniref:Peptidase C39-like domain-containing protein n=1 Tax=Nguyenibacter vanlangensis TaxID=1216886 RepID=A0A7Y7IWW0_9PROT|nr:hypothetical protein [Nguyenibacter vanlangensis]
MVGRRLGKLPPKRDPRTYRLAAPLAARLPAIPAQVAWSRHVTYAMWGNERYGDCAFAAMAALIGTWTKNAQAEVLLTTTMCLENYAACTGFDPATGANDDGTVMLDALDRWRRAGYARPGQTRDYLTAFGAIDLHDHDGLRRAVAYLGGVYAGIQVPAYLMQSGGDWALDPAGDQTIEGGHCIAIVGYEPGWWHVFTWGGVRRMAVDLWDAIADEAYGLVSRQNWLGIPGVSPRGEDLDALVEEMRAA